MDVELSEDLKRIESKLDLLKRMLQKIANSEEFPPDIPNNSSIVSKETINLYLLKLPDTLRRTMLVMERLVEASASEVAGVTGRSRSVESSYLNHLERMGYLMKTRRDKETHYCVIPKSIDGNEEKGLLEDIS